MSEMLIEAGSWGKYPSVMTVFPAEKSHQRLFACDVIAAMLEDDNQRFLISFYS